MAFLDFLFGGAKNNQANKEEEERKKREQEQAGKRVNDAINKWLSDNSSKWTSASTPAQQPQTPAFSAPKPTISNDVYNNTLNNMFGIGTPDLSAGATKKTTGNSPLLTINEASLTGNRNGWGYGSGDAPSKEASKEWDDLLDPTSNLSKSMDQQQRVRRINSEIPAWYVNAHKAGTTASARRNVGSKYLLPEDGNIATGTRENMVQNVSALYDQRETGRFDYQKDPWGNLADPSLYSADYLQEQVDYFTDQTEAKKSRAKNAIHGIEDINEAMAWSFNGRDFDYDTNPVSDFELEGYAKYVEGSDFDPASMTKEERQAMADRYLEWGRDDGITKLQEQLNNGRTLADATYVENAGVSDAYEDWLGKLKKEQTFRFDYGRMSGEARRDPNFAVNATYDGPLPGNDFASRLYNALNDENERFKFDLPYENGGAASPITAEGYDLMTPKELEEFNWYAKQGHGQEYLDMMKGTLQHRNAEAQALVTQYYATKNAGTAALTWGVGRFANLGTAMMYPFQAANAILGGETDAASSLYAPNRLVNDVAEAQTQAIANSNFLQIPSFAPGTNLGTWLYSAATSAADSLLGVSVGTALGGGAGTGLGKALANLVMSSTAASHALEDNLLQGMDPTHAFLTSVADGAAEAITETWSIESLLSDPTHFLSYLAKNVFSEASEEGASSILQAIGDRLINGDNSQMSNDVNTLVLLGMKKEDAEKRVMSDWLNETLQGMAIGGLSGGMSAGGWQIGNAIGEAGAGRQINRSIFQNAQRSFLNNQAESQTETAAAQQTEEQRRAPEAPNKESRQETDLENLQNETMPASQETGTKPQETEEGRRAPETPDKAPMERTQDEAQPKTAPAEDQRRAPETPDKAPMEREQDAVIPVQTKSVNAQTDNVNENVDGRRAPEQPIQQSARSREAEQMQEAESQQAAQDQQSTEPAEPAKRRAPEKPTKEARNAANRAVLETQQKVADIGATLAEGSEARKVAEAALKKLQKGQRLGGRRTYQLYSKVYEQLGENVGSAVKTAARQDIDLRLQEAGMESEEARRASGALADILTGHTDNVGDADLKNLLTTRQTRELLQAFTGIDSRELNRKMLEMAGELPQVQMQLRESAYYNPDNRKTMDSWSMMRRILSGQYTVDTTKAAGSQESGEAAQADQERRTGNKEEITYADADGNDVTGTIVKITTRAAGQKAANELRTKAATQPASQESKTTSQQIQANEAGMEGLSEEAREEWRKIQQDRENGPRQVKIEVGNGPTMEEFHKTLRGQMSARMGEDIIESVNDIVLTVRDGNGNTSEISIDDVTGTANDGVQAMLEYAMATPEILGDGKLNLMFQWYQGEQPESYLTAFQNVYNAGFSDYIMDPVAISTLGDTRAQAIFDAGQQAAQAAESVRRANIRNVGKGKGTLTIQGIDNSNTDAVNTYLDTLDENQRASYEALRPLARATGVNIVLFRSQADENGRITSENGHYDPYTNSLYLDLNAGLNMSAEEYAAQGKSVPHYAILRTAGHELTHYIENSSAEGYAKLRAYVETELLRNGSDTFEELIERKMDLYARAGNPLTREGAISEVIADSMEMILQDSKAIQRMANQDASVFQRIRNWLHTFADNIRRAFTGVEADSLEARAIQRMGHYADQLVKLWDDALMEASANNAQADQQSAAEITEAAAAESVNMAAATDAPVQPARGNVLQSAVANATQAKGTDGGDLFSLRSMTEDKETLLDMVRKTGVMSVNEINQLSRTIDAIMDRVEQNPDILDFGQNIGRNNRSFVPVKPNSDPLYKVSLDLSTLCRKRILQQAIQERLENQYNTVLTPQQRVAVRDALFQLAKQGKKIEVACALCYVESARLKSPAQIDRWLKNKDEFMRVYFSKANKAYAQQIQDRVDAMARELGYEEGTSLKQMSGKDNKAIHKMKAEMYRQYQPTAEEQKIIETAKALPETMYKTAQGLWELKQQHPEIFESFTTHVRNATKSKGIEGDTPFYAGDTDSVSDALIKAMNAENGMRMQSWSDYQVYHTLDYISAMIELGSRGAKVQTYTKVPAFLKLMGHTGAMINMSMIPADYNGQTLEYDNVEGMDYDTMMELRDAYHATAGNIVIGISDAHIRALLAANDVDYVIPYHKSSLNAKMREAIGLKAWTDFEKYQNETNRDYDNTIKNEKYRKHVNFSEWFNLAEARRYAQEYTRLPQAQRTQGNDVAAAGRYAMQKMADRYIELCHERGLQEKFAQFANEDGYWKLLIDRKMVDNVTGEIIEQQPVRPIFSKDDILDVLNDEVKRFQAANKDQQEATEAIVKMWEEGKIQEAAKSTKIMNYFQNYYAHVAAAISQGPADVAGSARTAAKQYEFREYSEDEKKNLSTSKSIVLYESEQQYRDFIAEAVADPTAHKRMYLGKISPELADAIEKATGVKTEGYNLIVGGDEINKVLKKHGNSRNEARMGQIAITPEDFEDVPLIISSPDVIIKSDRLYNGDAAILFIKLLNGRTTVVSYVSNKKHGLRLQTMYRNKNNSLATVLDDEQSSPNLTSETPRGTAINDRVPLSERNVNGDRAENNIQRFDTASEDIRYSLRPSMDASRELMQAIERGDTERAQEIEASDATVQYSIREEDPPKKTVIAYKAFYARDGKLYPPMISNQSEKEQKVSKATTGTMKGLPTPVGVWLNADVGGIAVDPETGEPFRASTTGRLRAWNAKSGGGPGKTPSASNTLAFRPGWHLGEWPDAKQFNKNDPVTGKQKSVMPDDLVFAKCEIAADVDYQLESIAYGVGSNGKFNRSQAGLPRIPTDGFYKYRTNPDPDTAPWYITGAMRVIEILDDDDCAEICAQYGVKPDERYSHKKINLADYGLKRGPVEPTTDVDAYRKNAANYANEEILERALNDTNFSNAYVEREINFDDPIVANEFAINKQDVEEYRRKYNEQREQKAIQKSLRLEPMTTTREYIMGLTDDDLQTEAERAVLAKYRQKVTEYGTAAAAREKYENDLLNYNGQDQNELTKLNNRAQLARERLNRVQAELEQIERSNAFVRIAADARQAMSVIQSVAGSGNVDQYLETMRTRLANAQSRMDDILKDLEGWPKPTEGTTARMVFGKTQLSQKVSDLMKANPSTLSKDEVTDSLAHIALLYQIGDAQAIEDANREVEELARKLQLQKNESIESFELTQLADAIGAFSLNDNQKKEVKRVFGSINNFKKALQGYGRYDPKATNLDANWNEMVELTGNQLDANIGDAEEPIALVDFISRTVQSAQEAAALSPEDMQAEFYDIQTEILTAATDLHAAIPMSRETLTAIQDLIKTFGSRADKLGDQLIQLLHDSEHARANADLAQATYTANGGRIIKGVDAIRSYYSQVADQYTKEILLQKERELRDRYANQMRILRTNAAQRLQEQANNYRQQIKDVRELRDISQKIRTARNVVRRQIMRVNKLLLQETNTKNVPEGLKGMAEALVSAFARADQFGRGIILSEGEANKLILEYSYLMRRDGDLDSYAYDPDVLEQLRTIKDQLDEYRMASIGHAYYDLNNQRKRLAICQNIAATVNDLTSLIVNANYVFVGDRKMEVGAAADRMAVPMLSMKDYARPTGGLGRMASNVDEFARWGNMTPYYFKRQIDNAGFTPLMDDLERSEHRWGLQMQSAHDRINEMRENYHAADWDDDKLVISDNRGGTIEITRGQAMSILAIWQREHHDQYFQSHHLDEGGFVLAEDGGKLGTGLLGLDRNAVGRTRGARITMTEIKAISDWLTDEQKAYMNEMISYLSNEMSDIGNETSMKLYGIKKYKEKVYFPIQSYRGALTMKSDAGAASTTNDSRIEHVGFSNARLRDANNTILIDDFSKVAAGHIQQMLMYANFAPTIEALNKVLNAQFEFEDGEKMRIRQMFENKYGKNAKDYLQDYIKALNGGVNPDTQDSLAGKMISLFKKTAVVGSVSVAAKQPMSIIRAATMINPRYLAAAAARNLGTLHGSKSFEEARKYAGTAVIKDIGKFDTGVGMSNVDWLLERDSQEYDLWTKAKEALNPRDWEAWKNRWNEILGFLPEKGDTVTWGAMWEAVKMEQHAQHPSMNQYSTEFLQMCGERFNTVMRATQVYDSTIARSPNLRSKSQFMKMLTAFMNEPVLTANMLYDSIKNIKKAGMTDHINPAAAGAAFLLSAAAQAFITSLFSALRSDDKEKTIAEKMAGTFGQNLRGEVNPFNLIPGVADIVEILEGGEVERADLSVLTDAVNKMTKLASGKYAITDVASGWKAVEDVGGSIAKLFGVPVKNIMRELRTVYNVFTQPDRATDPTVFRLSLAEGLHVLPDKFLGFTLVDTSTQAYVERMYKALRAGDEKAAADFREYLIDGKGVKEGSIKSKIKSLLYADYAAEEIGIDEAIQFGMDQELWKKEKDAYSALIQAADKADHSDQEEYKTSAYVKIYDALLAGDKAAYNAAAKDMASHGYTDKAIQSEAKSQIGKWYKDGELSQAQATSMLAMLGITAKNDVYWTLDAWDYQAENGDSSGYTKYDDFLEAVETGRGLQAAIQAQVQHSDKTEKEVKSTLASQITSKYKDQYVQLVRAGRTGEAANLQARLLTAYEALGYNRAKKLKDIQKWLK